MSIQRSSVKFAAVRQGALMVPCIRRLLPTKICFSFWSPGYGNGLVTALGGALRHGHPRRHFASRADELAGYRQTRCAVQNQADWRAGSRWARGEQGIVGECRIDPDRDGINTTTQLVHEAARAFVRN